ncbi:MAG: putative 2OG-Fe(II) oxygenase [Burkholderiaceae bacterium]
MCDRTLHRCAGDTDPLRSRYSGRAALAGAWSVRLRSGGHHVDHVRFGRPGFKTQPPLEADHFVKPRPGLLVLFPAYIWPSVEPFESDHPRLTVAFDAVPA